MDFFRYTAKYGIFSKNTTYCVYSPDADVILLTLSLGIENICLIKEDTSGLMGPNWTATTVYRKAEPKQFELVMINILREYFEKEFSEILK
jgi:5'-3' exonuclease